MTAPSGLTRALAVPRSLVFYPVFYVGTVLLLIAGILSMAVGRDALQRTVRNWCRWHRFCARWIVGIRVVSDGPQPDGPVLVAIKHESMFEAIDLPLLIPRVAAFAKIELMRLPLWGALADSYGLIGVEREGGAKALRTMLAASRERVADNRPLAIFPEGTRVPHGENAPLQSGFAGIYKLLALPVVPAAVNSGPLYHRLFKLPGTITVRFGETIPAGLTRDEIEARVRAAINALNG